MLLFYASLHGASSTTTLYVNKYFEVRQPDQPTKYVYHGETRVAHVIGSLSTNWRIQRLRLHAGWNLLSLAVTAADALRQFTNSQPSALDSGAIFQWTPQGGSWTRVSPGETLAAGTVVFMHAATNAQLALTGSYADPSSRQVPAGSSFGSGAGLEAWNMRTHLGGLNSPTVWRYDALKGFWQVDAPLLSDSGTAGGEFLPPGAACFLDLDEATELQVPEAALRIRYYHQDYLGSSSVITDFDGTLIEEIAYLPHGTPRSAHRIRQIEEEYRFTQKERDRESGLHYFSARYVSGTLARFASLDPKYLKPALLSESDFSRFLTEPQRINLYSFALNNPVKYHDPTGLEIVPHKSSDTPGEEVGKGMANLFLGNDHALGEGMIAALAPLRSDKVPTPAKVAYAIVAPVPMVVVGALSVGWNVAKSGAHIVKGTARFAGGLVKDAFTPITIKLPIPQSMPNITLDSKEEVSVSYRNVAREAPPPPPRPQPKFATPRPKPTPQPYRPQPVDCRTQDRMPP